MKKKIRKLQSKLFNARRNSFFSSEKQKRDTEPKQEIDNKVDDLKAQPEIQKVQEALINYAFNGQEFPKDFKDNVKKLGFSYTNTKKVAKQLRDYQVPLMANGTLPERADQKGIHAVGKMAISFRSLPNEKKEFAINKPYFAYHHNIEQDKFKKKLLDYTSASLVGNKDSKRLLSELKQDGKELGISARRVDEFARNISNQMKQSFSDDKRKELASQVNGVRLRGATDYQNLADNIFGLEPAADPKKLDPTFRIDRLTKEFLPEYQLPKQQATGPRELNEDELRIAAKILNYSLAPSEEKGAKLNLLKMEANVANDVAKLDIDLSKTKQLAKDVRHDLKSNEKLYGELKAIKDTIAIRDAQHPPEEQIERNMGMMVELSKKLFEVKDNQIQLSPEKVEKFVRTDVDIKRVHTSPLLRSRITPKSILEQEAAFEKNLKESFPNAHRVAVSAPDKPHDTSKGEAQVSSEHKVQKQEAQPSFKSTMANFIEDPQGNKLSKTAPEQHKNGKGDVAKSEHNYLAELEALLKEAEKDQVHVAQSEHNYLAELEGLMKESEKDTKKFSKKDGLTNPQITIAEAEGPVSVIEPKARPFANLKRVQVTNVKPQDLANIHPSEGAQNIIQQSVNKGKSNER